MPVGRMSNMLCYDKITANDIEEMEKDAQKILMKNFSMERGLAAAAAKEIIEAILAIYA